MNSCYPQWFFLDHLTKTSVAVGREMDMRPGCFVDDVAPLAPGFAGTASFITWTTQQVLLMNGWKVAGMPGADKPA